MRELGCVRSREVLASSHRPRRHPPRAHGSSAAPRTTPSCPRPHVGPARQRSVRAPRRCAARVPVPSGTPPASCRDHSRPELRPAAHRRLPDAVSTPDAVALRSPPRHACVQGASRTSRTTTSMVAKSMRAAGMTLTTKKMVQKETIVHLAELTLGRVRLEPG